MCIFSLTPLPKKWSRLPVDIDKKGKEMNQQTALQPQPLAWGHGPRTFEVFLEPTCPFSVKAFNKLDALLKHVGEDKVTVKIRLQSQPWHIYSGLIVR